MKSLLIAGVPVGNLRPEILVVQIDSVTARREVGDGVGGFTRRNYECVVAGPSVKMSLIPFKAVSRVIAGGAYHHVCG
jgi:hypothetical protein